LILYDLFIDDPRYEKTTILIFKLLEDSAGFTTREVQQNQNGQGALNISGCPPGLNLRLTPMIAHNQGFLGSRV
jgi:hypothetical protein